MKNLPPIPEGLECTQELWEAAIVQAQKFVYHIYSATNFYGYNAAARSRMIEMARLYVKCGEVVDKKEKLDREMWREFEALKAETINNNPSYGRGYRKGVCDDSSPIGFAAFRKVLRLYDELKS